MNAPQAVPRAVRSDLRRQQVLDAAAECFRQYGFHGASIARISKVAGMSPGHIYHFFENKEAIIAAIVARKVEQSAELAERINAQEDVFEALMDCVEWGFNEKTDPEFAALWLEVLAEAARNPQIALIVQDADRQTRDRLQAIEESARKARSIRSGVDKAAANEVIMALFEGLANRVVQHPEMDREEVVKVLRVAARAILEA